MIRRIDKFAHWIGDRLGYWVFPFIGALIGYAVVWGLYFLVVGWTLN